MEPLSNPVFRLNTVNVFLFFFVYFYVCLYARTETVSFIGCFNSNLLYHTVFYFSPKSVLFLFVMMNGLLSLEKVSCDMWPVIISVSLDCVRL